MAAGVIKLTAQTGRFNSAQTNFPVVFNATLSSGTNAFSWVNFFAEMSDADRKKVKIYLSDRTTELKAEIEPGYDFANSKVVYHVKADNADDGDIFYLDYDSSWPENTTYIGDTGDAPAQDVWDVNFKYVSHMAQDPSGSAPQLLDSTSNNNNGTSSGSMTSDDLVDGLVGKAINFDSNDYIDLGDFTGVDGATELTLEIIGKLNSLISDGTLLRKWTAGNQSFKLGLSTTGGNDELIMSINDPSQSNNLQVVSTDANLSINTDYSLAGVWHGSNVIAMYKDGINLSTSIDTDNSPSSIANTAERLAIAARYNGGSPDNFGQPIPREIRISDIIRSVAWIKATSYSLKDDMFAIEDFDVTTLPPTTLGPTTLAPSGWIKEFKGSGPWNFIEQPDKWGYLNNRRWTNKTESPVNYTGNELNEPQIWTMPDGIQTIKDNEEHHPCGHWHKRLPDSSGEGPVLTDKANIYGLFTNGNNLWGVHFNGESLSYIGKYQSDNDINGLVLYEGNLVTFGGKTSTADVRLISSVAVAELFPVIQVFNTIDDYALQGPGGSSVSIGLTDTEIVYIDATGILLTLDNFIQQIRTSFGTVILHDFGNGNGEWNYISWRGEWFSETFWTITTVTDFEGVQTLNDGDAFRASASQVNQIIVGDYMYTALWASSNPKLQKYDLSTHTKIIEVDGEINRKLTYYQDKIYVLAGTFGANVHVHSADDLSTIGGFVHLTGYLGDIAVIGNFIIAVTEVFTANAGIYKIDPDTLDILGFIISTTSYKIVEPYGDANNKYAVLGGTGFISILDIENMVIVATISVGSAGHPELGYNQQQIVVKNIYE